MGQIEWTISLVLVGLFTVAILGFAIGFANDNSSPVNIANDPNLSTLYSDTGGDLVGFNTNSDNTYTSTINSSISPTAASGTTATAGQFAITPVNIIGVVTNVFNVGFVKIFGGSGSQFEIFLLTFLGLIVFITALYIWKTWAGRSPD